MTHHRTLATILGLMLIAAPCVGAEKTTQEQLKELQQQMLLLQQQLTKITQTLDITRDLTEIKSRLSRLEDRMSEPPPQVRTSKKPQETGEIKLENRTIFASTITLNGRSYRLLPGELRTLREFPVGEFNYRVEVDGFGVVQRMRTRDLVARETYAITILP